MRTIKRDIVGAFIFSNDNHLLLGKNVKGGVYENLWVIPGGGIDPGETKEQAVIREIREEVGIDISASHIESIPEIQKGKTEKTLRETGERVLVDMTFYNFKATINLPAQEIYFSLEDDFGYAEWVAFSAIKHRQYSTSVENALKTMQLL